MRKGSLKLLLSAAVMAVGTSVFAASPVLKTLPIIVISDVEDNITQDENLFQFTDAFTFDDYATDADTPVSALKWSFDVGSGGTGSILVNNIPANALQAPTGDPANPAFPINVFSTATFIENTLSPGGATGNPVPSEITPSMGQPADIDGDGTDDKLVGELVVTFFVADDQNDLAEVAQSDTFVWTYDTDFGAAIPIDHLQDQGLDFVDLPLDLGSGTPGPGVLGWFYRSWSQGGGGSALTADWLEDAVSGTQARLSAFEITGAGTSGQTGSFNAAYGEWIAPGDPTSLFTPGNVYSVRAAFGLDGTKTDTDQPRIGIAENTVANINQTYVVNAPTDFPALSGTPASPFLPAAGSTKQYLSTVDPIDADVQANVTTGDGDDIYYLFNFDFVNPLTAIRTATLTSYEVGSGDSATYNSNETSIMVYDDAAGANTMDDWTQIPPVAPLALVGGATILVDVQNITVASGSIAIQVANQADASSDISFAEVANFASAGNIDDIEVIEGAAYRADYEVAMNGGTQPGVSGGNTLGIPALRLRSATPIPSYSIELAVNPRNTNLFTADDVAATVPMYWTASTQLPAGSSGGEENDAQIVFGVQDFEWTDGTATLDVLTVYELNADDPNVDY